MSSPDEITINSAVQRCVNAWREALARKNCKDPVDPGVWERDYAGKAYRKALPWLSTPDNVDAFIACVAQGLAIGAIDPSHATKLLYAAQVAITSRRARLQADKEARAQTKVGAPGPSPLGTGEGSRSAAPPSPLGKKVGEAAAAAPQVPEGAPYLRTASPSGDVGDHGPKPAAAPQVPALNRMDALLEEYYGGQIPTESAPEPFNPTLKKAPAQAPPPPSPLGTDGAAGAVGRTAGAGAGAVGRTAGAGAGAVGRTAGAGAGAVGRTAGAGAGAVGRTAGAGAGAVGRTAGAGAGAVGRTAGAGAGAVGRTAGAGAGAVGRTAGA
ncbi:hypothetical protein [Occallatibacter riparius]|uniref:Uncharacterized protein n=1 Tax=Occallatibacter riparius TaxID=1002689 RepID=A0A9J7BUX2_9BACT|nr:hypothetical protein [Occallatibacter riparius]UWZ86463.1 hypothetical protein MOP44_11070 [Occallatibacter riparius]